MYQLSATGWQARLRWPTTVAATLATIPVDSREVVNCEGGANMTQEYGSAGKVHDTGEDHVPIKWPDLNQQLPAAVRDHAQKQSVNQTMTNPSGAGDLHNLRMTGPNHPPGQSVSPLTQHHNRWRCCSDWTYTRHLFSVGLGRTTIPSWNLSKQFSVILRM